MGKVGNYVLVENEVPEGYEPAKPKALVIEGEQECTEIQSGKYRKVCLHTEINF